MSNLGTGKLKGKVALVAGGSSGINLEIAHGYARQGAKVALLSRSLERIEAAALSLTSEGFEAIGIVADVRDFSLVDRAFAATAERWGEVDLVLSGAAGNFLAAAKDLSANGFKTVVDIDLIGTFNVFRASWPYLRKPGASLIAITGPIAARPFEGQVHACAAKAGVNMLVQCLALEWGPEGVRANAISPGPIGDTEGMRRLTPTPDLERRYREALPLKRYGEKRDIAELAVFLSSDDARFITGAIVNCDGGAGIV
jgi:NAD(P)-dependent dehydrogenase (short-subunit alcohol dehydrogenase family)